MSIWKKVTDLKVNQEFLNARIKRAAADGYGKARYIAFCEHFLSLGFDVYLYEARRTESKYVTVKKGKRQFKVRFSAHKPIKERERAKDCDFFVGMTNYTITNTSQAIRACIVYFGAEEALDENLKRLTQHSPSPA